MTPARRKALVAAVRRVERAWSTSPKRWIVDVVVEGFTKAELLEAHREGIIQLTRGDLVNVRSHATPALKQVEAGKRARSLITAGNQEYHYVRLPEET